MSCLLYGNDILNAVDEIFCTEILSEADVETYFNFLSSLMSDKITPITRGLLEWVAINEKIVIGNKLICSTLLNIISNGIKKMQSK